MAKSFKRPPVFLSDKEVHGNHHGEFAYRTADGNRIRFDEFDKLGRLTGVYYQPEDERDRTGFEPRRMIVKYSDESNRPYAIWFSTRQGFHDKHFCFQYKPDGSLKTVYYWGDGGNTNTEYHYSIAQKTVTLKVKGCLVKKTTSQVVLINDIEAYMIDRLPDLTQVSYFYTMYCRDRSGNELNACFDVLGINSKIYYAKPVKPVEHKKPPKEEVMPDPNEYPPMYPWQG